MGRKVVSLYFVFASQAEEEFWCWQEIEERKEVRLGGFQLIIPVDGLQPTLIPIVESAEKVSKILFLMFSGL